MKPLIVQSDGTILVEVDHADYEAVRDSLVRFAELVKSPEHIHTYRLTPLSLWNAAATGMTADDILATLEEFGRYGLPPNVGRDVRDYVTRYGLLRLEKDGDELVLICQDPYLAREVRHHESTRPMIVGQRSTQELLVQPRDRGHLKQALIKIGYPVEDLAGYVPGEPFDVRLRAFTTTGIPFALRDYQVEAVDLFYAGGSVRGGSGVIVLPCGSGKTIIGLGTMARVRAHTLILTTSTVAVRQWLAEIHDKTHVPAEDVGEYTGDRKELAPITVTTYQTLTYRPRGASDFPHLELFTVRNWGLIIYDEVHLLPAPVFRITAEIQARRRLGLTATLVREDGREDDVFSLIGPKRYDVPWRELEQRGWIAEASCTEIRVGLSDRRRLDYAVAPQRQKYRVAAENPQKLRVAQALVEEHRHDRVLVIGQYLDQLQKLAQRFKAPLITGQTPNQRREELYDQFRRGEVRLLVVSKVANYSIDLPDANVAVQVSGLFGSRQEEAQRLGRILRPKTDGSPAHFYTLVTRDTIDQEFAARRQLYLTEQGYRYTILDWEGKR